MCCSTFWMLLGRGQQSAHQAASSTPGIEPVSELASIPRTGSSSTMSTVACEGVSSSPARFRDATYDERWRLPAAGGAFVAAALMLARQRRERDVRRPPSRAESRADQLDSLRLRAATRALPATAKTGRRLLQPRRRIACLISCRADLSAA